MPQEPIALGIRLVLNLGRTPVPHSSSARERLICALNSTARNMLTTQDGVVAAKKSPLLALDAQDSTLHEPGSETSAVST